MEWGKWVDFSRNEISKRLQVLSDALGQFPTGVACPWPLARIFNELLKQTRMDLDTDPVVKGMRYLEEVSVDEDPGASNASVGTVRALIEQINVAFPDSASAKAGSAGARAAKPKAANREAKGKQRASSARSR